MATEDVGVISDWKSRHWDLVQQNLNEFRSQGILCDGRILLGDRVFPVHRNILAVSCPYFRDTLTGETVDPAPAEFNITDAVTPEQFDSVMYMCYTSQLPKNLDAKLLDICEDVFKIPVTFSTVGDPVEFPPTPPSSPKSEKKKKKEDGDKKEKSDDGAKPIEESQRNGEDGAEEGRGEGGEGGSETPASDPPPPPPPPPPPQTSPPTPEYQDTSTVTIQDSVKRNLQSSFHRNLNDMIEREQFCDIELRVENRVFRAHKNILAAASEYFRSMFTSDMKERSQGVVTLKGVSGRSFYYLMEFMYTGDLQLCFRTVNELLVASSFLQIRLAIEAVAQFLYLHLDAENCLDVLNLTETYGLSRLGDRVYQFIKDRRETWSVEHMNPQQRARLDKTPMKCIAATAAQEFIHATDEPPELYIFDDSRNLWKLLTSLPHDVSKTTYFDVAAIDHYVYVIVGDCDTQRGKSGCRVFCFDALLRLWSEVPQMRHPRSYFGLAALGGHLYVVGGRNLKEMKEIGCSYMSSVERFEPLTNSWSPMCSLPVGVRAPRLTICMGNLWAFGDHLSWGDSTARALRYDPAVDRWAELWSALPGMKAHTGTKEEETLYAGRMQISGPSQSTAKKLRFDPKSNRWREETWPTYANPGMKAAERNYLYLVQSEEPAGQVVRYDILTEETSELSRLPDYLPSHPASKCALLGNRLLFVDYKEPGKVHCYNVEEDRWSELANFPGVRKNTTRTITLEMTMPSSLSN
ncbi:KBTBD11 [Branchiostoma lanceolatum]|uniref:KBTBD11 protein n=1 Tax=Branchiostoma lanceolatum TaxID=7740 RepID=A0A8K0ER20_BRALA|nr:KBTBD11 [Branchiostoma lanceolatum]